MRKFLSIIGLGIIATGFGPLALADAEKPLPGSVIQAGDIRAKFGYYSVVFYFTPSPAVPTASAAKELAESFFPGMPFVSTADKAPSPPFIAIETEPAPLRNFAVPEASSFRYFGRGLGADDVAAVQKTTEAIQIAIVMPRNDIWPTSRRFTEMALTFAEKTGAFIWDSNTRECFSRAEWKKRRLDNWQEAIPHLADHFTIHLFKSDDSSGYLRAITLGMDKFGLPDLVIQRLLASDHNQGGNLINVVAQALAENSQIETPGKYAVRVADLKDERLRKAQENTSKKGATGEMALALVVGIPEEGDPDNRLVELDFRNSQGRTPDERRIAAFAQFWGASEAIVKVKHDDALQAASRRAKEKLPELQQRFSKGLATGERILLKAPFARDDEGKEWMWVEILKWPAEGKVTGILQNDPFYIKLLRTGSRVLIKPEEVFDYIYYKADGSEEGNETGQLMRQRNLETETK